jgi:hypothetical protein
MGRYSEFNTLEKVTINDLREKRNKIYYEGLLLPEDYLEKRRRELNSIINKLKLILKNKLE